MAGANQPKFAQIRENLRREILEGRLAPGEQVPSEREIAKTFDVALMTARRALAELASQGYVVRHHGRGTFVTSVTPKETHHDGRLTFRYLLVGRRATDPAYSVILHELVRAASEVSADLVCSEVSTEGGHDQTSARIRDLLVTAPPVDGIVINGETTEDQILEIQRFGIPFVLRDTPSANLAHTCDWVNFDHHTAAEILVEHLIDLGHRRIGLISGDVAAGWPVYIHAMATQEFREGYCAALGRHDLPVDRGLIASVSDLIDPEEGRQATRRLLSLDSPPTAIVALSSRLALGVLDFLKGEGIAVPGDVSVASAADFPLAREAKPPITVAGENHRENAHDTIRLLMERIKGIRTKPVGIRSTQSLVARESTGPCRDASADSVSLGATEGAPV